MKTQRKSELDLACEEVARLQKCARTQDDNALLDSALNGEITVVRVTSLMEFLAKHFPRGNPSAHWTCAVRQESDAFDRWWGICSDYLLDAGVATDQLPKKPAAPGGANFVSVLAEFED